MGSINDEYKKRGACIFSHRVMMACKLKGIDVKEKFVSFRTGDDLEKTFKKLGSSKARIPVLVHYDEDEKENIIIEDSAVALTDYIMQKFPDLEGQPESALQATSEELNVVGLSLFSKFSAFMREPDSSEKHKQAFEVELKKLDEFLKKSSGKFLDGSTLKLPDCGLLPKLHHVMVAAERVKGYKIPRDRFERVFEYFEDAQKEEAFKSTAPEDEEIVSCWREKRK